MSKSVEAFRTIGEVADELDVPKHVLRFWEGKFPHIRPMKRGGGRRYYRPEDMELLRGIRHLLHAEGYTIKGVQKILRQQGIDQVKEAAAAATAVLAAEAQNAKSRSRGSRRKNESATATPDVKTGGVAVRDADAVSANNARVARDKTQISADSSRQDVLNAAIKELELCLEMLAALSGAPLAPTRSAAKLRASRS